MEESARFTSTEAMPLNPPAGREMWNPVFAREVSW